MTRKPDPDEAGDVVAFGPGARSVPSVGLVSRVLRIVRCAFALPAVVLAFSSAQADGDDVDPQPPVETPGRSGAAEADTAWQEGTASWYGPGFHGRLTANGETYDQDGMTAAHRWLPFGALIRVTNLDNGCSLTLRVTDRGPYHGNRILDCSRAAAEELGFIDRGVARIRWDIVQWPPPRRSLRLGFGPAVATSERPMLRPPRRHEPPLPISFDH